MLYFSHITCFSFKFYVGQSLNVSTDPGPDTLLKDTYALGLVFGLDSKWETEKAKRPPHVNFSPHGYKDNLEGYYAVLDQHLLYHPYP